MYNSGKEIIHAIRIDKTTPNWLLVPKIPRYWMGEISVRNIGPKVVDKPQPMPFISRPDRMKSYKPYK